MSEYKKYINTSASKCRRRLSGKDISILISKSNKLSEVELDFVKRYFVKMPVGIGDCTCNRLCNSVENELDNQDVVWKHKTNYFDYTIYKSGVEYSKYQSSKIKKLYDEYHQKWVDMATTNRNEHKNIGAITWKKHCLLNAVKQEMLTECDEESLCNVLLDLTYGSGHPNPIVWDICGKQIIKNLLAKSNNARIRIKRSNFGVIVYQGDLYEVFEERSCLV